ncbi:hypothetical protein LTR91_023011 [Friedmanniomyces endolithicus]|uniref:General stress protein FMN-binding split barrel domain-containing protein n=2 Tax=Dothideomycetidae TaxID=451867 RepID=A0A4U0TXA9_9PEZI|nr:hypothetical protein LTS09_008177 [Friedmanniomyces endolithicus]KAK5144195.1 hypothetical protein LTR32_003836 [Rachicladosporium monterosium]KAK0290665.1 hypothetical protein LTS00_008741 [Friedmanniomyces endolithicus]KAK0293493.1 hypothetical protein LTR35_000097 [Friedmanniomyces endolithicus]KAK0318932.1 hypothetical protein LTR82_010032 [Friedmanniomyces endolithicus]
MPESAKSISKNEDPSVTKQWDDSASTEEKFNDAFAITDKLKICMFGSARNGIGPVSRAMAVAKRSGPDFLFLANANSQKFDDLEHNLSLCQIAFHDSQSQNWCCISGEAVKTSADDKRIKEIYNPSVKAWFGDLGDGTHDGGPEDPRVKLIEVRAKYISYWKSTVGSAEEYKKEIEEAAKTGGVAKTGVLRNMKEDEIKEYRSKNSSLTS